MIKLFTLIPLLCLFEKTLYSQTFQDFESFQKSYQKFQELKNKDKALENITSDIQTFLEAKKKSYHSNSKMAPKTWRNVFSSDSQHMKSEFIKAWTAILKNKNLKERIKLIPLNRLGEPSEVIDLIDYLTSNKNSYLTGEVINFTGGE